MKKIVAWLAAGLLMITFLSFQNVQVIQAEENQPYNQPYNQPAEQSAASLKSLKLFAGNNNGFDLYRTATRTEGAVMLVRLLGKENLAKGKPGFHPFLDVPKWASGYVGLLYQSGLSKGIGAQSFGSTEALSGRQFGSFILRALGYAKEGTDIYRDAISTMINIGIISSTGSVATYPDEPLMRSDMVMMSEKALSIKIGNENRTLLDFLVISGQSPAEEAGKWLASKLAPEITAGLTDPYDKVLQLHNWIINSNTYGFLPAAVDPTKLLSGEGYSTLSLGTGVCGAYSEAMDMLCEAVQVPCIVISGKANGTNGWIGHAWNQVQLYGQWYHMDVTFDDPLGATTTLRHNYFNVTDTAIANDHQWDRSLYQVCTATEANYFIRNGQVVSSYGEFQQSILKIVEDRGTELVLRVQPYNATLYNEKTIREILVGSKVVSGYTHSLDHVMGIVKLTNIHYFGDITGS